jgi:hypothetical protein
MAKPSNPNKSVARSPADIDPTMRRTIQDLFDRVNFLIGEVEKMKAGGMGLAPLETKVAALEVSLQAATDAGAAGTTFVGFGQNLPAALTGSVNFLATGVGMQISGPSGSATITIVTPATFRAAIVAAVATAVGAHTITLAALTGGGTQGSISWNADGTITAFVDPT